MQPGIGLAWFARHEMRLAWREWLAMMSGGRIGRRIAIALFLLVAAALIHLLAYGLLAPWVRRGIVADRATLVLLTGSGLLFWTVMLSQALESITRVYYARSDLDLILSSPASARQIFAVRTAATGLSTVLLAALLACPLLNMLAILDGPRWLAGYGVVLAMGAFSTALALATTLALFKIFGPKRTRLIAQIVAAVVGAGFVIGIQAAAIIYYGSFSRFTLLQAPEVIAAAPSPDNLVWLPAKALMGDPLALAIVLAVGLGALALAILLSASSYGRHAISTAGLNHVRSQRRAPRRSFRPMSQRRALRLKEWRLLQRDPWLLSQTLMQLLYLLPPALLLWLNFGSNAGAFVVVVPVLVMAAGQLAGGLAWLAISGEDAHDLVATAPLAPRTVLLAKIEAVLAVIAIVLAPLLLALAVASPFMAFVTAVCVTLSAGSATTIQLWFRVVARRSMFRRRQVASRAATLSEAFASIMWAATGAVWATGSWLALGPAIMAIVVMGLARLLSPRRG